MLKYQHPSGLKSYTERILSTPEGGKIVLDAILFSLWQQADDRELKDLDFQAEGADEQAIRAALACLTEAGLLMRQGEDKGTRGQGEGGVEEDKGTRGQGDGESFPLSPPLPLSPSSLVSVVIVGYNSQEWFEECLDSLFSQTHSPLEIIVVDNASSDDSVEWLKANYPGVQLICLETTHSLAYAINQGVAAAIGENFLILNPDVKLEPDAVSQMVAVAQSDLLCAGVAAKLKFGWAPAFLNGLGNRVQTSSWGTDNAIGYLDLGQFDTWSEVPSACFAATLIPRTAWEAVGPLDEGFPLYYEDSEWSYRARMLGYTVRLAPQAVIYHAFGSKVPSEEDSGLTARKLRRVVYGRLRFVGKIVSFPELQHFLRNYGSEDLTNFFRAFVRRDLSTAQAYLSGWWDFLQNLPTLWQERRNLQARRSRSDEDLFALQREMPTFLVWHGLPELTWDAVLHYYLPLFRSARTKPMPEFENWKRRPHLLIVSNDVVDTKMAGPGMRYLEMARALSSDLDVTLAIPSETTLEVPNVSLVRYWEERPGSLQVLIDNSDVALISGYMVEKFPSLQHTQTRLVVDLYDPFILENLHYHVNEPISAQETFNHHAVGITNSLACLGDFFICGSDRQRDFWMGMLAANERINPRNFAKDSSLRALIDVIGIGFPSREPIPKPMLRGVHRSFPEDAQIVLWGGGIWDWLDPLTLVKAWPKVLAQHPQARLIFLGTRHPNPLVPRHKMADETLALAAEIGEKDSTIFFYEWLPYEEREALLCEADIGVTFHPVHVETRYSIRTRVLDYLWARLPVLITEGDVTSEWIHQYGVGKVVPPLDVEALAQTLGEMLEKPKSHWASAFEPLQKSFCWSQVVEPLRSYCLYGEYAPDRQMRSSLATPVAAKKQLGSKLLKAFYIWQTQGFRALLHRLWRRIR